MGMRMTFTEWRRLVTGAAWQLHFVQDVEELSVRGRETQHDEARPAMKLGRVVGDDRPTSRRARGREQTALDDVLAFICVVPAGSGLCSREAFTTIG
jgi:hypothetical protein